MYPNPFPKINVVPYKQPKVVRIYGGYDIWMNFFIYEAILSDKCVNYFVSDWNLFWNTFTVEPRFNEVPRDWENMFVKSRVRYIGHLHLMNFRENYQNFRYIEV